MSMRIGVGDFSANKDVGVTREASALAVDIFMKRRRSIEAYSACRASVPDAVGVSQMGASGAERHRRDARRVSELARANQTPYSAVRDATRSWENNWHSYGGSITAN